MEELKKEFYKNFVEEIRNGDEYDGDYLTNDPIAVWNWFESKVSQMQLPVGVPSENSFGQWINIEDKYPEEGVRILFYDKYSDEVYIGYYDNDYEFTDDGENCYSGRGNDVTHWMPLPKF